jgi:CRISPR-associated protein Cmr1
MRKPPDKEIVIPTVGLKGDRSLVTQERRYELITPLFGGGVEPGECDVLTPIRGTEIRGQLRFWWRATRGGRFDGDLKAMKSREDEIWGAASVGDTHRVSQVSLEVVFRGMTESDEDDENLDQPFTVIRKRGKATAERREGSLVPAYLAFPLQPSAEEAEEILRSGSLTKSVRHNLSFTLKISFRADQRTEIEASLWAWETFGGIGARTRRGFGALSLNGIIENNKEIARDLPVFKAVKPWIQKRLKDFDVKGEWPCHVPHLPDIGRFKVTKAVQAHGQGGNKPRALEVLAYFDGKLRSFRQSRYNKRLGISRDDPYGLSRWPEAEEIRRRFNLPSRNSEVRGIKKFPRAKLGLPIIFHLPHDDFEVELKGTGSNRTASPLIFRPLVCAEGNVLGLALVLSPASLPPDPLKLARIDSSSEPIDVEPGADLLKIKPLHGERDIFKAFLDTLQ